MNFIDPLGLTTWPTRNWYRVTTPYGPRIHPVTGNSNFHSAIDFGQRGTDGSVFAVESGIVYAVGKTSAGTNYIKIKDKFGYVHGYFHTKSNFKKGNCIEEGQVIGISDMSGHSTGLHLHYTIQFDGTDRNTRFDPLQFLNGAKIPGL